MTDSQIGELKGGERLMDTQGRVWTVTSRPTHDGRKWSVIALRYPLVRRLKCTNSDGWREATPAEAAVQGVPFGKPVDWSDPESVGARYDEEAARHPLLAQKVSRDLYIRRNLRVQP